MSELSLPVAASVSCALKLFSYEVRGYVTGTTSTSLWTVYNKGVRNYCGNSLPDGKKHDVRRSFATYLGLDAFLVVFQ